MIRYLNGYTSNIPLNHPRIGYENYPATASGDAGETYDPEVVTNETTYDKWDPIAGGTLTLDFGSAVPFSYIAIGAHTLQGSYLVLSWSNDNLTYTALHSQLEQNESALMFVFPEITARYVRVLVSSGDPSIGVIYVGRILEMYRGIYSGFTPPNLNRNITKNLNKSVKGQFLGGSVVRNGYVGEFDFSNIPIDWYEENVDPLSVHAQTKPFFVAWNSLEHNDHTVFGYSQKEIAPQFTGTLNFCSFGFDLDGYA